MKIKSIIAGLTLTVGSLFFAVEPAQAEVCSTGTYTVAGINTFGGLPCSDPGTEINVTVRGLHDYGVPGGPTAYCSFIYVRKNLGTASSPNWSASTDTVCDPRPTPPPAPVVVPTPTPKPSATPEPSATPSPTPSANTAENSISYCQGSVCSTTPPTPKSDPVAAFAIVDENNKVVNVIVGNLDYFGNNDQTVTDNQDCVSGCKIILQAPSEPGSFNAAGYNSNGSTVVTYDEAKKVFEVTNNGVLIKNISAPEVVKTETSTTTVEISVDFSPQIKTVVNADGTKTETSVVSATVTGTQVVDNSSNSVLQENVFFQQQTNENVVRKIVETKAILNSRVERILKLLGDWIL